MRAEQERDYVDYVGARVVSLRRTAYRLCGDWHRAEDVVQETLVRLYRHWGRAVTATSLDAYVRAMLVNAVLDEHRGGWFRRVRSQAEFDESTIQTSMAAGQISTTADQTSIATDQRLDLMAALARISPGQRAVLVLRYWEGLDVAETAEAMGCGVGTVKSQTSYAIAALRRLLPDYISERLVSERRERE